MLRKKENVRRGELEAVFIEGVLMFATALIVLVTQVLKPKPMTNVRACLRWHRRVVDFGLK